jgi:hypothetical protein
MSFLVMLALFMTVVVLFFGVGSMALGGEFDQQHSHEIMYARVGMQAAALLLIALAVLGQGG